MVDINKELSIFTNFLEDKAVQVKESILDEPRESLSPKVWQLEEDKKPVINPEVKAEILRGLDHIVGDRPVEKVYIVGSITGFRYGDDADIDVSVIVEGDEDSHAIMRAKARDINGRFAPGTTFPINYFVMPEDATFARFDSVYDMLDEKWLKDPKDFGVDLNSVYDKFKGFIREIDSTKSEAIRSLVDIEGLFAALDNTKHPQPIFWKLMDRLRSLDASIDDLAGKYDKVHQQRISAFRRYEAGKEKDLPSPNLLPQNIRYKLLERYHYLDFMKKLYDLVDETGDIDTIDDVQQVREILQGEIPISEEAKATCPEYAEGGFRNHDEAGDPKTAGKDHFNKGLKRHNDLASGKKKHKATVKEDRKSDKIEEDVSQFGTLLLEKLGSYKYELPKDKEEQMNDFYTLTMMYPRKYNKNANIQDIKDMPDIDIDSAVEDTQERLYTGLRKNLLNAVFFSICAEIRHIYDNYSKPVDVLDLIEKKLSKKHAKMFRAYTKEMIVADKYSDLQRTPKEARKRLLENRDSYVSSYKSAVTAMKKTGTKKKDFVEVCELLFNEASWNSSFGDKAWAGIADGWLKLNAATKLEEITVWIDHVYDLQHNTDTVFNKIKSYMKGSSYSWIKKALDKKFKIKSPYELWDNMSPQMKRLMGFYFKARHGTTFQQWADKNRKPEDHPEFGVGKSGEGLPSGGTGSMASKGGKKGDFEVGDKVVFTGVGGADQASLVGKFATVVSLKTDMMEIKWNDPDIPVGNKSKGTSTFFYSKFKKEEWKAEIDVDDKVEYGGNSVKFKGKTGTVTWTDGKWVSVDWDDEEQGSIKRVSVKTFNKISDEGASTDIEVGDRESKKFKKGDKVKYTLKGNAMSDSVGDKVGVVTRKYETTSSVKFPGDSKNKLITNKNLSKVDDSKSKEFKKGDKVKFNQRSPLTLKNKTGTVISYTKNAKNNETVRIKWDNSDVDAAWGGLASYFTWKFDKVEDDEALAKNVKPAPEILPFTKEEFKKFEGKKVKFKDFHVDVTKKKILGKTGMVVGQGKPRGGSDYIIVKMDEVVPGNEVSYQYMHVIRPNHLEIVEDTKKYKDVNENELKVGDLVTIDSADTNAYQKFVGKKGNIVTFLNNKARVKMMDSGKEMVWNLNKLAFVGGKKKNKESSEVDPKGKHLEVGDVVGHKAHLGKEYKIINVKTIDGPENQLTIANVDDEEDWIQTPSSKVKLVGGLTGDVSKGDEIHDKNGKSIKRGDKVKIVGDVKALNGKFGEVTDLIANGDTITVQLDGGNALNFYPDAVELVDDEDDAPIEDSVGVKMKVGDIVKIMTKTSKHESKEGKIEKIIKPDNVIVALDNFPGMSFTNDELKVMKRGKDAARLKKGDKVNIIDEYLADQYGDSGEIVKIVGSGVNITYTVKTSDGEIGFQGDEIELDNKVDTPSFKNTKFKKGDKVKITDDAIEEVGGDKGTTGIIVNATGEKHGGADVYKVKVGKSNINFAQDDLELVDDKSSEGEFKKGDEVEYNGVSSEYMGETGIIISQDKSIQPESGEYYNVKWNSDRMDKKFGPDPFNGLALKKTGKVKVPSILDRRESKGMTERKARKMEKGDVVVIIKDDVGSGEMVGMLGVYEGNPAKDKNKGISFPFTIFRGFADLKKFENELDHNQHFNAEDFRPLTDNEVKQLHGLKEEITELTADLNIDEYFVALEAMANKIEFTGGKPKIQKLATGEGQRVDRGKHGGSKTRMMGAKERARRQLSSIKGNMKAKAKGRMQTGNKKKIQGQKLNPNSPSRR